MLLLLSRHLREGVRIGNIQRIGAAIKKTCLEKVHVGVNQPGGDVFFADVCDVSILGNGAICFRADTLNSFALNYNCAVFYSFGTGAVKQRSPFQYGCLGLGR